MQDMRVTAPWILEKDGARVTTPSGRVISLERRLALRRILGALIDNHLTHGVAPIDAQSLVAIGWPGEKLLGNSGAQRCYVAIADLRRFGLRGVIESAPGGYRFAQDVDIKIVPSSRAPKI